MNISDIYQGAFVGAWVPCDPVLAHTHRQQARGAARREQIRERRASLLGFARACGFTPRAKREVRPR